MNLNLLKHNLRISGKIFCIWGGIVALKGFFDAAFGEPEANLFSPAKWEFVTYQQWLTWSGFEITYGVFCVAFGYFLLELSKRNDKGAVERL